MSGFPPGGPNYFRWLDGRLLYRHRELHDLEIVPSPEAWQSFWQACDALDVWNWPSYIGPEYPVFDGLQYQLRIAVADRRIESSGQLVGQSDEVRDRVLALHRACQELVGWSGGHGV